MLGMTELGDAYRVLKIFTFLTNQAFSNSTSQARRAALCSPSRKAWESQNKIPLLTPVARAQRAIYKDVKIVSSRLLARILTT